MEETTIRANGPKLLLNSFTIQRYPRCYTKQKKKKKKAKMIMKCAVQ